MLQHLRSSTRRNPHLYRYAVVGVMCTGFQLALFALLSRGFQGPLLLNAFTFFVSTQLNFALSYRWTWAARWRGKAETVPAVLRRLLGFNLSALAGLAINALAFFLAHDVAGTAPMVAALVAVVFSTSASYVIGSRVVFASPKNVPSRRAEETGLLLDAIDERPGVAFFLPAHNESENLPTVVRAAHDHLVGRGEGFTIIVVDDGSTDDTRQTLAALQEELPDVLRVVEHPSNAGYGAALRSGFRAGLETGWDRIAFCDSDRQFRPADLDRLQDGLRSADADIAIGYRLQRADNLKRRLMGRGWHVFSRLVLGYRARDVDCGFKLFRRAALATLYPNLTGNHATISPEILARAHRASLVVTEVAVPHYPRGFGKQTGANATVVYQSIRGLLDVRRVIDLDRMTVTSGPAPRPLRTQGHAARTHPQLETEGSPDR